MGAGRGGGVVAGALLWGVPDTKAPRLFLSKGQGQSVSEFTYVPALLPSRKCDPMGPPAHLGGERTHFSECQISTYLQVFPFPTIEPVLFVPDEVTSADLPSMSSDGRNMGLDRLGWVRTKASPAAALSTGTWSQGCLNSPHPNTARCSVLWQILPARGQGTEGASDGGESS